MLRMLLPYVLIFISVLGTYNSAELEHDHKWKDVLPYLNIKNFQETRSSVLATTNNAICAQHFQVYMDQITTSYWAMLMFDSSTKFPESVLMGQSVFLGNFDECIEVEHVNTGVGVFSGQHCLAEFRQKPDSVQKLSPQNLPHVESLRIRAPNVRGNDRTVSDLQFLTNPGRLYITNSTLSVDTFFVLSGLLLGYIFLIVGNDRDGPHCNCLSVATEHTSNKSDTDRKQIQLSQTNTHMACLTSLTLFTSVTAG